MPKRTMAAVCAAVALWAVSFGVGSQATSHGLRADGASDTVIGLAHAAYYLGVALASVVTPALTARFGVAASSLGMAVTAAALVAFPWAAGEAGWLVCRGVAGAGCAWALIPLETLISRRVSAERRSEAFGYFALATTLAGALGIALGLEACDANGLFGAWLGNADAAFRLGAVFPACGAGVAWLTLGHEPLTCDDDAVAPPTTLDAGRVLSFGTAWGQGFLEAGLIAFLSLHLAGLGLTEATVGRLMGAAMAGVVACQAPMGWLGDRLGRQRTLLACYAVTIAGLVALPHIAPLAAMGLTLFVVGACSGAMYPLGMALLGDLRGPALARAYATYLAMECVGSLMGAAIMGRVRDLWGGDAMFVVGAAALAGVVTLWAVARLRQTEPRPSGSGLF